MCKYLGYRYLAQACICICISDTEGIHASPGPKHDILGDSPFRVRRLVRDPRRAQATFRTRSKGSYLPTRTPALSQTQPSSLHRHMHLYGYILTGTCTELRIAVATGNAIVVLKQKLRKQLQKKGVIDITMYHFPFFLIRNAIEEILQFGSVVWPLCSSNRNCHDM